MSYLPYKRVNANKNHPLYYTWNSMYVRCYYPSHRQYADYGGRGIEVHPMFANFRHFLWIVGKRPSRNHTLDRIDNDRGYAPGNLRWSTRSQQERNKR